MPNCYFIARALFSSGDRWGAVQLLDSCIAEVKGEPVFEPPRALLESPHLSSFDIAVSIMIADRTALLGSFGRAFAALWELHPTDLWIGTLLAHDFYSFIHRYGPDPDLVPAVEAVAGFEPIVETLERSALKGLLAPQDHGLNSGRHVLRLEDIRQISDDHWGPLKPMLLERLARAYQSCPPDFWRELVASEPEKVVIRTLHDLFLEYAEPLETGAAKWRAIKRDHRAYSDAVMDSLAVMLLKDYPADFLLAIARVDAGFSGVTDGMAWLSGLQTALRTNEFGILAQVS